ncbi:hypothetical protein BDW62DRAFT_186818 [Aspergillus aurantiobrunneus]
MKQWSFLPTRPGCFHDAQCGTGSFCNSTDLFCSMGCRGDISCARSQQCEAGQCISMGGAWCRKDNSSCVSNGDCCSGKRRREHIIFGQVDCVPARRG